MAPPISTPSRKLVLELATSDDNLVLKCRGRLTTVFCEQFRSEVKKLLQQHSRIILDFADLHFVDSSGLAALLDCYVSAKAAGCDLRVTNANSRIKDLLNRTQLSFLTDTDSE
jgi:anti-anti-sigma factor